MHELFDSYIQKTGVCSSDVCDFNMRTLKNTFQGAWVIFTLKE